MKAWERKKGSEVEGNKFRSRNLKWVWNCIFKPSFSDFFLLFGLLKVVKVMETM